MSYKPCRIEVSGSYAQPGEHYICGLLFTGSMSAGCPDQRTLAQLDAIGVPYKRIPWHDPGDVERIQELAREVSGLQDVLSAERTRSKQTEAAFKALQTKQPGGER